MNTKYPIADTQVPRKSRVLNKLKEPLRIVAGFDRNGAPVFFIRGWITETERCNKQCPRDDTKASLDNAKRILEAEEHRRAQLLYCTSETLTLRLTRLVEEELREAEAASSALKTAGRSGFLAHIMYAIQHMFNSHKSRPLSEVLGHYGEDRMSAFQSGEIRKSMFYSSQALSRELDAAFPGITIHEFAHEKIIPPAPQAPKCGVPFLAALLGVHKCTVTKWSMMPYPVPFPEVISEGGAWVWVTHSVDKLRDWLKPLQERGSPATVPDAMPEMPFAPPPRPGTFPRSRIELFCERPLKRARHGNLAGSEPARASCQRRRDIVMHMLDFAVKNGWLDKLPRIDAYLKHTQRERGCAPSLSPLQAEAYLRWYERYHPEWACREAIKIIASVRPDGESDRFEAFINPATAAAVPQVMGKGRSPSPSALKLWPTAKVVQVVADCPVTAAGLLRIEPTVSKVRFRRQTHVSLNLALWIAVYFDQWKMGCWRPGAATAMLKTFDQFADQYYRAGKLSSADRRRLLAVVPLAHDVLRHTGISYFVARHGSFTAAAIESGNSESEIRGSYFDLRDTVEADQFYSILPLGWTWGADGKSFIPPAGWIRPKGWVLAIEERPALAA